MAYIIMGATVDLTVVQQADHGALNKEGKLAKVTAAESGLLECSFQTNLWKTE